MSAEEEKKKKVDNLIIRGAEALARAPSFDWVYGNMGQYLAFVRMTMNPEGYANTDLKKFENFVEIDLQNDVELCLDHEDLENE